VFFHGCSAGVPGAVCVEDDNTGGGYLLTRYLLSLGHTAVGGIFKGDDAQGPARYAGFTAALRDAGLPLPDGHVYWYTASDREDFLDRGETAPLRAFAAGRLAGCTAVVCYNGEAARLLVRALRAAGRRVPEDISVACFDASSYSDAGPLPLTTLTHGRESVARHAALQLIERMAGRAAAGERLGWVLVPRESTAKRKDGSAWTNSSV
jgi:GntR family transcriptional regulator of arabinose operon